MSTTTAEMTPLGASALPPPTPASRLATPDGRPSRRRDRWAPYARPALAVLLVVAAYRVTFSTLLESLSLDTPLAHLALVPLISLGLIVVGAKRAAGPPIHDRQLDWIVGTPLVLAALAANFILPGQMSTEFWVYRVDLLSLPLFVAGVIALLFGTRMLWRVRVGVLFLFLAWPYPYSQMLERWLTPFTAVTVHAVSAAVKAVPVATPRPGENINALFTVKHAGETFDLSVASECSGANGLIGFCLVGLAFVFAARGRRWKKVAWLLAGAATVWALNVVRILIIFGAGRQWGETVAIDGFHPVIGLVVFNAGVLIMALLMRRFGMTWDSPTAPRRRPADGNPLAPPPRSYRPAFQAGAIAVVTATLGVGILNTDLRESDLVASSLGSPRLAGFEPGGSRPSGWAASFSSQYDWSRRFFGADSTWRRYVYTFGGRSATPLSTAPTSTLSVNSPVIADVISTGDRAAFSNYGIEACYRFHNFQISKRQSVDLGNGVVGGLLTWYDPDNDMTTTTLYWHWPIRNGDKTRWERMTLLLVDQPSLSFTIPQQTPEKLTREFQLRVRDLLRGDSGAGVDSGRLVQTRQFLVAFGQELIALRGATADR